MDVTLNVAIARLADFRASRNADAQINEESKLTARDVDLILATLGWPEDKPRTNPVMREIR